MRRQLLVVISLILALSATVLSAYNFVQARKEVNHRKFTSRLRAWSDSTLWARVDTLQANVRNLETANMLRNFEDTPMVDLYGQGIQRISDDLMVSDLHVEQKPSGLEISGKLVNPMAVPMSNLELVAYVGGKSNQFNVSSLTSGGSSKFKVYIPDAPLDSRYCTISLAGRYISHR